MCEREELEKLKDSIIELQRTDAVQSEQIKTLFKSVERQGTTIDKLTSRLVWAAIVALIISLLALVFGALGEKGFNAVTKSVPALTQQTTE